MRLAVTEACTNVVRHAYENDGHIEIVIRPEGDAVNVIVSDDGRGIGPSPDVAGPGLGLPLIAALAERLEIEHGPSGQPAADVLPAPAGSGPRVEPCERGPPGSGSEGAAARRWGIRPQRVDRDRAPGRPVLRAVVGMLAARRDLPLDRLDDAVLVADLIAARAPAHVTPSAVDVALEPGRAARPARRPAAPGRRQALIVDAAVPASAT
jgi:hypothetical protein